MMGEDLAEVRKYISNLWSELVNPENGVPRKDPGVLAVVTNTAIEFGRSIAEDAMPTFQKHGGRNAMTLEFIERTTAWNSEAGSDFKPYLQDASTGDDFYDALPHCYHLTESTLLTLALVPWRGNTSVYPEGNFGVCEPEVPQESKTADQKIVEHGVITTKLWFEALALVYHVPDYPCTDEFIRGVKEFKETKEIPFSLVVAAQVNFDIHRVVGSYAESSVDTLLNRIESMNQDLKSHVNFMQVIKGPHWSARDEKWLKDTQEGFDWFLDDPLHKAKTLVVDNSYNRQEVLVALQQTKKWRILRRSPVIAGLALYYHRAEMHEAGLKVTNTWGYIVLPGHLYNALRKEECTKSTWLDMETLFDMFGEEQFFVGGPPDKVSDYTKRYILQVGVSTSAFSKNRRRGAKIAVEDFSRAGTRFLTTRASIHKSLQGRYHRNAKRMNWTAESINEILLRAESVGKGKGKRAVPSGDQESRISPVGVLSSLVMVMQGEVQKLSFGYLRTHQMSWNILRGIYTGCEPYLKETYGSNFTLKEWELPFMIGHILPVADDKPMDMLRTAGKVFDEMNSGHATIIGYRRMLELSGVSMALSEGQKQVIQDYIVLQEALLDSDFDTGSEVGSDEESDDEKFFSARHVLDLNTGQVNSGRIRIDVPPSANQQVEE